MEHNGIGENGQGLLIYLQRNTSINRLNVSYYNFHIRYCRLDDTSMAMMIKGLESNKSMADLDISGNSITAVTVLNLIKVVSTSRITYLALKGLRLSSMVLGKIEELARDKPDIKIIA
jgi:hypothetical protein